MLAQSVLAVTTGAVTQCQSLLRESLSIVQALPDGATNRNRDEICTAPRTFQGTLSNKHEVPEDARLDGSITACLQQTGLPHDPMRKMCVRKSKTFAEQKYTSLGFRGWGGELLGLRFAYHVEMSARLYEVRTFPPLSTVKHSQSGTHQRMPHCLHRGQTSSSQSG